MKTLNYSSLILNDLQAFFNIEKKHDREYFNDWFSKPYQFSKDDNIFLQALIDKHINIINYYTELELVGKFIAPILNRVDFTIKSKNIRDWYEIPLKYEDKNISFNGRCDFVVARGYDKPIQPYFFIQEFKQTSASFPEDQLLAEMIASTLLNKNNTIKGAYIMGSFWTFTILEKLENNNYQYYISKRYDSMEIEGLTQIYQNLQNIKSELMN